MKRTVCDLESCDKDASFGVEVIDGEHRGFGFEACTMEDAAAYWEQYLRDYEAAGEEESS